jgi:hypothetical protein
MTGRHAEGGVNVDLHSNQKQSVKKRPIFQQSEQPIPLICNAFLSPARQELIQNEEPIYLLSAHATT